MYFLKYQLVNLVKIYQKMHNLLVLYWNGSYYLLDYKDRLKNLNYYYYQIIKNKYYKICNFQDEDLNSKELLLILFNDLSC